MKSTTFTFKRGLLSASLASIFLGLAGCGGGSDGDSGTTTNLQMSGAVVDGFVANSFVWLDTNDNQRFDPLDERFAAITDAQGYFTTSADGTNYCADPNDPVNFKHCLKTPSDAATKDYKVCSYGGRDQLTGKLYRGVMCLPLKGEKNIDGLFVNPLTTLANQLDDRKLSFLATQLGFTSTDATNIRQQLNKLNTFDPNGGGNYGDDAVFKFAFQAHKLAEAMIGPLVTLYNDNRGTNTLISSADLFPIAFGVIGDYIQNTWTSGDVFASDITGALIDNLVSKLREPGAAQGKVNADVLSIALNQYNLRLTIIKTNTSALTSALTTNLDSSTSTNRRQVALAGETATEVVIGKSGSNVGLPANFATNINTISNTTVDINTIDFNALTGTVENGTVADLTALSGNPDLNIRSTAGAIDYLGTQDGNERNYLFFTNTVSGQQKGIAQFCIIDPDDNENPYEFITGSYEVDKDKKFIVYISALGQTYTVKNLKPSVLYKNGETQACTNTNGACTLVEYNDPDTGALDSTYYGSSNTNIIQEYSGETINDAFCKKLSDNTTTLAPTVVE